MMVVPLISVMPTHPPMVIGEPTGSVSGDASVTRPGLALVTDETAIASGGPG